MSLVYLDSSAIFKLVVREAETAELEKFLVAHSERTSSSLAKVEVARIVLRVPGEINQIRERAQRVLQNVTLVAMDEFVLERAGWQQPASLRALDAIHLATALAIAGLAGMVVYDRRLAAAAREAGLHVWAPGQQKG